MGVADDGIYFIQHSIVTRIEYSKIMRVSVEREVFNRFRDVSYSVVKIIGCYFSYSVIFENEEELENVVSKITKQLELYKNMKQ